MQIPAVMVWLTCDGGETYKRCTLGNINQFHRHVFFTFADTDASTGARTRPAVVAATATVCKSRFSTASQGGLWGPGRRRRPRI